MNEPEERPTLGPVALEAGRRHVAGGGRPALPAHTPGHHVEGEEAAGRCISADLVQGFLTRRCLNASVSNPTNDPMLIKLEKRDCNFGEERYTADSVEVQLCNCTEIKVCAEEHV